MGILATIAIAFVEIVITSAISRMQMEEQQSRAARETYIRSLYNAIESRFGITINQLDQALAKLDINMSKLTEAAQGSARLSRASEILRQYQKNYPQQISKINNAKNIINNEMNNLESIEAGKASQIQQGKEVKNSEVLQDAVGSIQTVNSAISDLDDKPSDIDTGLVTSKTGSLEDKGNKTEKKESSYLFGI